MTGPQFRRARRLIVENLEMRLALATFYVSPAGNDGQSGTSEAPWHTLQAAADRVQSGDTVIVRSGNYVGFDLRRSGTPGNPIVFHAEPGATITQRSLRTPDGINLEGADYVTVEGFTISGMPRAGIRAVENQSVTLRNNTLDLNARWGIFTGFSDDLLIEVNVVSRTQIEHGIYVSNSGDRPVIRGNTLWGNRDNGIHMNGDATMGGDGIISGALVEANVLFDNSSGGGSAINADGVQNSTFRNNLIYNTHAAGISLYRMDGGGPSTGNIVSNNTVLVAADGRWALQVHDGSTGNIVRNNVLHNDSSFRGSLSVSADSLPGFSSDYNALTGRFTTSGGGSVLNLAQWRAATLSDAHSFIASPAELFVNPSGGDFHLPPGSPAIDAGTTLFAPPTDLEGIVRPSGSGLDIGAFELPGVSPAGSPSALYHFDQSSGSAAADSSGNGQTATIVNQPLLGQPGVTSAGS
ncbi:MAG TPA: right-handed parallel beta-helix repeat-containing protein, partial [Pirellulaceae bacterium]|nr:right-handed parallel beta-helix repeat-containing protein [Pirellulaceae bacterium]